MERRLPRFYMPAEQTPRVAARVKLEIDSRPFGTGHHIGQ
jgi:hypothetical protein